MHFHHLHHLEFFLKQKNKKMLKARKVKTVTFVERSTNSLVSQCEKLIIAEHKEKQKKKTKASVK